MIPTNFGMRSADCFAEHDLDIESSDIFEFIKMK